MKDYFEKLVKQNVFPGCNYAILYKDKIEINSVGNKALIPEIEKNNLDTLYDLASLTKVLVTNVLISKLLEKNVIKLTDKVVKYLPKFRYDNITIFHLLTHSSGLIADVDWSKVNNKDQLIDLLYEKDLYYPTGKDVIYSDLNFIFLGFIIEKIHDKPLDVIASEEIFKPLNMNKTAFNPKDKELCAPTEVTEKRGIVRGFVHDEKAYLMDGVCGSAGVFSNVLDLLNFVKMILNDGVVNGKEFISKKYIDLWFTPLVKGKQNNQRSLGWCVGKGKATGSKCSDSTISHTGFTGNTLIIDREKGLGFIQLSNRIHPTRENKQLIKKRKYIANYIYNNLDELDNNIKHVI